MLENSDEIRISVALVTRNRPESLERCLLSWRSQTVSPFEIVVSDDSDESYSPQIRQLAQKYSCVYTEGPRRGLYANRNHASLKCQGSHILSADDDHTHPIDYVEKILKVVKTNCLQVWIFTERNPSQPDDPLVCPAEMTIHGGFRTPPDISNCAAIADGSSVYPHQIFKQGLRYDETYFFGGMWYLWGLVLVKNGWITSFSEETFVWHHIENGEGRLYDQDWLRKQIECNLYVLLVNAYWISRTYKCKLRALFHTIRSFLVPSSIIGYKVKTRLSIVNVVNLLTNVFSLKTQKLYCGGNE